MTRKQVIVYATALIDEVSPSGAVATMDYNETIERIMQSVADEYALMYPAVSPITKKVNVNALDNVQVNTENTVKGTRIKLNAKLPGYVKFRGIVISDGTHKYPEVSVSEIIPMTGKKRRFVDGNNLKSLSVLDTVLFYQEKGVDGVSFIDVFPAISAEMQQTSVVKYDSTFSTGSTLEANVECSGTAELPPSNDRGFFDTFCWYLAYRSMQVMGINTNMIQAAQQKVQAHFELIKNIP